MIKNRAHKADGAYRKRGLLLRLLASRLGNSSLIMALATVPILGIIGGGIDAARGYAVKLRLQHACDSAALAIRRVMANSRVTEEDIAEGKKFFDFNFSKNIFGINPSNVTTEFKAGKAPGTVDGSASAKIDLTVMRVFGLTDMTVGANCEATTNIPNTDVMFVLDVTGSMSTIPAGDTISRLASLKLAVKDFYAALGSGPATGAGRIRYGFVPYSSTVNVGNLLRNDPKLFLGATPGDTAEYYSRTPNTIAGSTPSSGPVLDNWTVGLRQVDVYNAIQNRNAANPIYWGGALKPGDTRQSANISSSLFGNNAYFTPIPSTTINWGGCIEEPPGVNTITASTPGLTIPSNAYDMIIDHIPANAAQKWRPLLPEVQLITFPTAPPISLLATAPFLVSGGGSACPTQASKLRNYSGATSAFNNYVDSLTAIGGTYHDIGMVWGARLLSPTGLFASENSDAEAPGGFQVSRHIVFMTDGQMAANPTNNSAWGITLYQGRDGATDTTNLTGNHIKRLEMICESAKSKGFIIWVVGFGISSLPPSLSNCASDADHASLAQNQTAIRARFKAIAETIGGLRLSE